MSIPDSPTQFPSASTPRRWKQAIISLRRGHRNAERRRLCQLRPIRVQNIWQIVRSKAITWDAGCIRSSRVLADQVCAEVQRRETRLTKGCIDCRDVDIDELQSWTRGFGGAVKIGDDIEV